MVMILQRKATGRIRTLEVYTTIPFKNKKGIKPFFRPYIFTRFSLWSITFFFTAFSPYPEKRISF